MSKPSVRKAIESVHVTRSAGKWNVVTIAPKRKKAAFVSQVDAVKYAKKLAHDRHLRNIIVHDNSLTSKSH